MKKLILALCLLSGLAVADGTQLLKDSTPANVFQMSCMAADPNGYGGFEGVVASRPYILDGAEATNTVYCESATCTGTWETQTAPTKNGPWTLAGTGTDPTALDVTGTGGVSWTVPTNTNFMRFRVTIWTTGKFATCMTGYRITSKVKAY